jgi:hypothetical protein
MSDEQCTRVPREGVVLSVGRDDRNALWWLVVSDLTGVSDIHLYLNKGDVRSAMRLRRRFERAMRLLDDLGWEAEPGRERVVLTMPHNQLRPLLERVYWESVGSLADRPGELVEQAREYREALVVLCSSLLARMSEVQPASGLTASAVDAAELARQVTKLAETLREQEGDR